MTVQKVISYIVSRRNRFLLLAVLITAGLTLRIAAQAKYNAYMDDFTSAIAGDFFFTSNYLYEEKIDPYQINSFDGVSFDVEIVIRNFENSLRYNKQGTDFYYTVEAKVCTENGAEDPSFRVSVAYGDASNSGLAATDSDGKQYGFLEGMDSFSEGNGSQKVLVSIEKIGAADHDTRYLKITAHSIPKQLLTKLGITHDQERQYAGVYYGTLEAVFNLNVSAGNVSIKDKIESGVDYTVRYRLQCDSSTSGTSHIKVFYNAEKLSPDVSLGVPSYDSEKGYYIQTSVKNGGVKDLYFYKSSLDTTIDRADLSFAKMTNAEIGDTSQYDITIATVTGGSAQAKDGETTIDKAMAGTEVQLALTPAAGYGADGASVTFTAGEDTILVSITSLGDNTYSFVMPSGAVNVTPRFKPLVQIAALQNGTITVSPANAEPGTTVMLTVTPDAGYQLSAAPSVKDAQNTAITVTEQEAGVYSFVMPEIPVTVQATFVEVAAAP